MSPLIFYRRGEKVGEVEEIYPKLNLLGHAQLIELSAGSQCGGHGVCGADRVKVESPDPEALSNLSENEIRHLSELEIREGYRLACQCFPEDSASQLEIKVTLR